MSVHTRVHTYTTFANPHLHCDACHEAVPCWHNGHACGCGEKYWNAPCGHSAGTHSVRPWSPVEE